MTKRDYVEIAAVLRTYICEDGSGEDVVADRVALSITRELSDLFAATNPRFDPDRFLLAAGAAEVKPI